MLEIIYDYENFKLESTPKSDNFHKKSYFECLPDGRQEIFIFRDSLMPEHQLIEENENIAERSFFDLRTFRRSGLNFTIKSFDNEYTNTQV